MAKKEAAIDCVAIMESTESRPVYRKKATHKTCHSEVTILMSAHLRFSPRPFITAAVIVMTFVAKTPGSANKIAACARRVGMPGSNVSNGAIKQNRSVTVKVTRLANVVRRSPPRHMPSNLSFESLFCEVNAVQPFCMASEDVAWPMLIKFRNWPTQANIAGGRKMASSLFIANARSALNRVTAPEPAKSLANFKSVDIEGYLRLFQLR